MCQIATGVPRAPDSDRFSTPSRASEGVPLPPLENSILVYPVESLARPPRFRLLSTQLSSLRSEVDSLNRVIETLARADRGD